MRSSVYRCPTRDTFVLYLVCAFLSSYVFFFFFFKDTAPPEIYPLPLHDALPILKPPTKASAGWVARNPPTAASGAMAPKIRLRRSEEHTSELQSHLNLLCRL